MRADTAAWKALGVPDYVDAAGVKPQEKQAWTPIDSLQQAAEDLARTCRAIQPLVNDGTDEQADRFEGDVAHIEQALAAISTQAGPQEKQGELTTLEQIAHILEVTKHGKVPGLDQPTDFALAGEYWQSLSAIRAIVRRAATQADPVPWMVLVPVDPTPEMEQFICNCDVRSGAKYCRDELSYPKWQDCYRAMLAAAPKAAKPSQFWLIERGPNQGQLPHVWWLQSRGGLPRGEWVTDALKATRFATKAEAETTALADYLTHYAVTSHGLLESADDAAVKPSPAQGEHG
jgi:hypothetical protein